MRWLLAALCLSFAVTCQASVVITVNGKPVDKNQVLQSTPSAQPLRAGQSIDKILVLKSARRLQLISDGKPALLGRPWQPHAAVAFLRCEIDQHIKPEGWDNWRKPENEKTARYCEYQCTGAGADHSKRVSWSKELTADEAEKYTVDNILSGNDHWKPAAK